MTKETFFENQKLPTRCCSLAKALIFLKRKTIKTEPK
jgi:hypothetical protein